MAAANRARPTWLVVKVKSTPAAGLPTAYVCKNPGPSAALITWPPGQKSDPSCVTYPESRRANTFPGRTPTAPRLSCARTKVLPTDGEVLDQAVSDNR